MNMTSTVYTIGCGGESFDNILQYLVADDIDSIKLRCDDLTKEVRNIKSWRNELTSWYGGLSSESSFLYDDVVELRDTLAVCLQPLCIRVLR